MVKRLLLLALALLMATPPAVADVELLPSPPVVGDGQTPTTIRILVPDMEEGERFRIRSSEGRFGDVQVTSPGLLSVSWFPPRTSHPRSVPVTLQRRGAASDNVELEISLVPPHAGTIDITFDPPSVLAGHETAVVRLTPRSSSPQDQEARRYLLATSAGSLDALMPAGDGSWVARFTPPADLEGPRSVIITAADAAAPDLVSGWGALPVRVRQPVSLEVPPDSTNILELAGRSYGPTTASPAGTVAFDVELDPTNLNGLLETVDPKGKATQTRLEIPYPGAPQFALMPLPPAIPADPDLAWPVRVVVTDIAGAPVRGASPVIRTTGGKLTPVTPGGAPGIFEAALGPPSQPGNVLITVEHEGAEITSSVEILPTLPAVTLTAEPPELSPKARDFKVQAVVKDALGKAVTGAPPHLVVDGASRRGRPQGGQDGTWSTTWRLNQGSEGAAIQVEPHRPSTGLPPFQLLAWPRRHAVPADGAAEVELTVVALDRLGLPVPGLDVSISVPGGDMVAPPEVRIGERGLARATLRAGTTPGLQRILVEAAGLSTHTAMFQVAEGDRAPQLEVGGDQGTLAALARWRAADPRLHVQREGTAPPTGPPALVNLRSVPQFTTPGAAVQVTVEIQDMVGTPVTAVRPDVNPSKGSIGDLADHGDGSYTFTVQLPAGEDGPLTVAVKAGEVDNSLHLPTLQEAMAAGAVEGLAPAAADPASDAKGPRKPRERSAASASGLHRLRLQGGITSLGHDYHLIADDLEGTPQEVSFTSGNLLAGKLGGAPAVSLSALARMESLPLDLEVGLTGYLEFVEVVGNTINRPGMDFRALGRYRTEEKGALHFYGMGGWHRTSSLVFTYSDSTRTGADVERLPFNGLCLGGGAAYKGASFWAEADLAATFGLYPLPAVLAPRLSLGLDRDTNFIFLSLAHEIRNLRVDQASGLALVKGSYQPITVGVGRGF